MNMTTSQRLALERSLAHESSKAYQSQEDHLAWTSAGHTFRTLCHINKIFVIWKHTLDGPEPLGSIRIVGVNLETKTGMSVCIAVTLAGKESRQWITHNPSRIQNLPIFAHIPYMCDLTYTPEPNYHNNMVLRFPIVFKLEASPKFPVNGGIYLSHLGEFRSNNQEFSDLFV